MLSVFLLKMKTVDYYYNRSGTVVDLFNSTDVVYGATDISGK